MAAVPDNGSGPRGRGGGRGRAQGLTRDVVPSEAWAPHVSEVVSFFLSHRGPPAFGSNSSYQPRTYPYP
eukprot:515307-Pyramimonas_sp.AAC.1